MAAAQASATTVQDVWRGRLVQCGPDAAEAGAACCRAQPKLECSQAGADVS